LDSFAHISPAALVFLAFALFVELMVCVLVVRTVVRTQPRSLEGWAAEAERVSHRVPATGALYAAGVLAFLWIRAHL
jgi:hypothetical protein